MVLRNQELFASRFITGVNNLYAAQAVDPSENFGSSGGLPLVLSKLFHPTQAGHAAIAQAIKNAIEPA